MIVTTTDGRMEFPTATRFLTEELFNNLVLQNAKEELVAVFAQDKWISVEVDDARQNSH